PLLSGGQRPRPRPSAQRECLPRPPPSDANSQRHRPLRSLRAAAGPLPPPSLASPLKSDSILPLGDSESLTVNVSIFRRYVSSSRSRRAHHRSSAASTYTLLRALSFSRTVEPAHPLRLPPAHA